MTERELQSAIVAYARLNGWLVYHTFDSRRSEPGFPDLTMLRERLVMAELKTQSGPLTASQKVWHRALEAAGVEFHLWRPADWTGGRVDAVLGRKAAA